MSLPYVKFYTADYLADTIHLDSPDLHGAYLLILFAMSRQDDCMLPDDPKRLATICRTTKTKFAKIWNEIEPFFEKKDGKIFQKRLLSEVNQAKETSKKNSENAKKRWGETAENSQSANATASANGDAGSHQVGNAISESQLESDNKPPIGPPEGDDDMFGFPEEPPSKPKPKPKTNRATSIPNGFPDQIAIDAAITYWREQGRYDLDVRLEADKFRDNKLADGRTHKDWRAAWRTWYRNAVKFNRKPDGVSQTFQSTPMTEEKARSRIEHFKETGKWASTWGPTPDEPGCRIPSALLRDYGYGGA